MANKGTSGGGGSSGAIRAGRAFVELYANDSALRRGLDLAAGRVRSFGALMLKGGGAILGAGLAGGAIVDRLTSSFTDQAVAAGRFATRIGVGVEQLTAFLYAAETTGQTAEDLAGHFENLAERIDQGTFGSGEAALTFQRLNLDAKELRKLNPVEQLLAIADAMQAITNNTERRGMLSTLGGDKFQGLNELMLLGSAGIKARMAEASRLGTTFSAEEVKEAADAQRELSRASTAASAALTTLGRALMPSAEFYQMLSATVAATSASVRDFLVAEREAVAAAGDAADGMAGAGAGIVAVGAGIFGVASALPIPIAPPTFAVTPVGLLTAGLVALTVAATRTEEGGQAIASIGRYAVESGETFATTWAGIKDTLASGDLSLAMKVAAAGLSVEWKRGLQQLTIGWVDFKTFFVEGWHDAMYLIDNAVLDGLEFLRKEFEATFSKLLRDFAALRDLFGDSNFAQSLRVIANANEQQPEMLTNAIEKVRQDAHKAHARGQEERAKARTGQLDAAQAELDEARKALADQVGLARWVREQLDMGPKSGGNAGPPVLPRLTGAARGLFATGGSAAQAFAANTSFEAQTLKLGGQQLAAIEAVAEAVRGLGQKALVFGP